MSYMKKLRIVIFGVGCLLRVVKFAYHVGARQAVKKR